MTINLKSNTKHTHTPNMFEIIGVVECRATNHRCCVNSAIHSTKQLRNKRKCENFITNLKDKEPKYSNIQNCSRCLIYESINHVVFPVYSHKMYNLPTDVTILLIFRFIFSCSFPLSLHLRVRFAF